MPQTWPVVVPILNSLLKLKLPVVWLLLVPNVTTHVGLTVSCAVDGVLFVPPLVELTDVIVLV